MKTLSISIIVAATLACVPNVRSQSPEAGGKSPDQTLREIKARNTELIEKQNAALQALDGMLETARAIKSLAKRS